MCDTMKARIAASSCHSVRVQNAKFASANREAARFPDAALAWRAARNALNEKIGK